MKLEDVNAIVAKVFSLPESEITDESSPETIESWDSFNGLVLGDELETHFKIKFSISEITDVKKQIQDLQAKGKNLSKQDIMSFADLESGRTLWAKNFELLGKMTPDDMALTGLKFNKRNKKLYIEGISVVYKDEEEYEVVHDYINRMKRNSEFSNRFPKIKFRQGSLKKVRGQEIVHFEVEAAIKPSSKKKRNKRS